MQKKLVFFIFVLLQTQTTFPQNVLRLATAGRGGGYFETGQYLEKVIEESNPDLEIDLVSTNGSVENAEKIEAGSVDLALMQSDIAYYFHNGERTFKFPSDRLKCIASLYTEPIHIIVKKSSFINNISDLRGKTVSVGAQQSGTEFNTSSILGAYGLDYNDITEVNYPVKEALDSLFYGNIDAVFLTSGVPSPVLANLTSSFRLLALDASTISVLRQSYPYFVGTSIPNDTYKEQSEKIFTVGVRSLLVCHERLDSKIVIKILNSIYSAKEEKSADRPIPISGIKNATNGITIPLHRGSISFYKKNNILKKSIWEYLFNIFLGFIIILVLFFTIKFYYSIKRYFKKSIYLRLAVLLLNFFVVGTIGIYFFEHNVNDNFNNLTNSFWTTSVYLISGFEGAGPITTGGKFSSILIFLGSIGILGSVTGKFASIFITQGVNKMPQRLHNHIAICNWNNKGDKIVKELHHPSAEPNTEIIILSKNNFNEEELRHSDRYENVFFIKGDPVLHDTLKAARIHMAKSVILLADPSQKDPDPTTAIICLAIRKLSGSKTSPHIICEILNHQKREHLLDAGANEVVSAGFYRTGIMLQSALNKQLSDIYHQLLIITEDTNEFYIIDTNEFPDTFYGKTFVELSDILLKNRDTVNPVILAGIRRGEHVLLNPIKNSDDNGPSSFDVLKEGDALIVMAYKTPNIKKYKA